MSKKARLFVGFTSHPSTLHQLSAVVDMRICNAFTSASTVLVVVFATTRLAPLVTYDPESAGPWQDVPTLWRDAYSLASLLHAVASVANARASCGHPSSTSSNRIFLSQHDLQPPLVCTAPTRNPELYGADSTSNNSNTDPEIAVAEEKLAGGASTTETNDHEAAHTQVVLKDAIKAADMALMMGGPRFAPFAHSLISLLTQQLPPPSYTLPSSVADPPSSDPGNSLFVGCINAGEKALCLPTTAPTASHVWHTHPHERPVHGDNTSTKRALSHDDRVTRSTHDRPGLIDTDSPERKRRHHALRLPTPLVTHYPVTLDHVDGPISHTLASDNVTLVHSLASRSQRISDGHRGMFEAVQTMETDSTCSHGNDIAPCVIAHSPGAIGQSQDASDASWSQPVTGESAVTQPEVQLEVQDPLLGSELTRVAAPDLETFLVEYFQPQRPVAMTGLVEHWPALSRCATNEYSFSS